MSFFEEIGKYYDLPNLPSREEREIGRYEEVKRARDLANKEADPVGMQEPDDEEEDEVEPVAADGEDAIADEIEPVVEKVAIPKNQDTKFIEANEEQAIVKSIPREPITEQQNYEVAEKDEAVIFTQLLNEGNFVDLAATVHNKEDGEIRDLANIVLDIAKSARFHTSRVKIFNGKLEMFQVQHEIDMTKNAILGMPGVPKGVAGRNILWDALSFKILPNALELFFLKNPGMPSEVSVEQMAMIPEIERQCLDIIKAKCKEYRERTETKEDDFIPDVTLFLELQVCGYVDDMRPEKIAAQGRGKLIEYVNRMQSVFQTGNLPGAIQPAKIHACHDIVSAAELKGSIMKMSQSQTYQQIQQLQNPRVMSRAYMLNGNTDEYGGNWSRVQEVSIGIKQRTDAFQRRIYATFGEDYDRPMSQLQNQLAGSANNLRQNIELKTGDIVVNQNEEQKEISKQQISVLLACLRMRANAVQQSDWELVTTDDFDHMEIVKYLCLQAGQSDTIADHMYRTATALQEAYARGHNVRKFLGKTLPADLHELLHYCVSSKIKQLGFELSFIGQKKGAQALLANAILQSLAQQQRVQMEYKGRAARKKISEKATKSLL